MTPEVASGAFFLYYLLNESGEPVYIGRTCDVAGRIRNHYNDATRSREPAKRAKAEWLGDVRSLNLAGPFSYHEARRAERRAIEKHQPRGNRAFTLAHGWLPSSGIRFEVSA